MRYEAINYLRLKHTDLQVSIATLIQVSCLNCNEYAIPVLDTNILIESKNRTPFDVFPSYWEKLKKEIIAGNVFTSEKVKNEIFRGNEGDELVVWIDSLPNHFFIDLDAEVMIEYARIINCVNINPNYLAPAKAEFASADIADAFLIATASAKNILLVTNEVSEPQRRNRVKIPDVAASQNVICCSLIDMLRGLHISI